MLPIVYILIGIWLIYMATPHPTGTWTVDQKQFPAPRIIVFAHTFANPCPPNTSCVP